MQSARSSKYKWQHLDITWTILLFIPGSAALGYGFVLDQNGWTDDHGIAANVYAAFTTGWFAVPIALIVLQGFLRRDADNRRRSQIVKSAQRTISAMHKTTDAPGVVEVREIADVLSNTRGDVAVLRFLFAGQESTGTLIPRTYGSLRSLSMNISEQLYGLQHESDMYPSLLRRWRFLTDNILLQAEAEEIEVLSDEKYSEIANSLRDIERSEEPWYTNLIRDCDELVSRLEAVDPTAPFPPPDDTWERIEQLFPILESLDERFRSHDRLYHNIAGMKAVADRLEAT